MAFVNSAALQSLVIELSITSLVRNKTGARHRAGFMPLKQMSPLLKFTMNVAWNMEEQTSLRQSALDTDPAFLWKTRASAGTPAVPHVVYQPFAPQNTPTPITWLCLSGLSLIKRVLMMDKPLWSDIVEEIIKALEIIWCYLEGSFKQHCFGLLRSEYRTFLYFELYWFV